MDGYQYCQMCGHRWTRAGAVRCEGEQREDLKAGDMSNSNVLTTIWRRVGSKESVRQTFSQKLGEGIKEHGRKTAYLSLDEVTEALTRDTTWG